MNLLLCLITCTILSTGMLTAQDEIEIISGDAEYNGEQIFLSGQVKLNQSMGILSAEQATLSPSAESGKKSLFSSLSMEKDVSLELTDGGIFRCQTALLDCIQLKGVFCGNEDYPDVTYSQDVKGDKEAKLPLIIKSKKMLLFLQKELEKSPVELKEVHAEENVRLRYGQDYWIEADSALYEKKLGEGFVTILPGVHHKRCQVSCEQGNSIVADKIRLDLDRKQLFFDLPIGFINNESYEGEIHFNADELVVDEKEHRMQLLGHVSVLQGQNLELTTPYEVMIKKGPKGVERMTSEKETEILSKKTKDQLQHRLICHGPLTIDLVKSETFLQSPKDASGAIQASQQVSFEDDFGDIQADDVHIYYTRKNKDLIVSRILMRGNVKLINRFNGHLQESGSVLQYALADQVEYQPATQELMLTSRNKNRVLFYDKVNNMQMSAPAIKVVRNANTSKPSIQGMGDVHLTFIEQELKKIRQHFNVDQQPEKDSP